MKTSAVGVVDEWWDNQTKQNVAHKNPYHVDLFTAGRHKQNSADQITQGVSEQGQHHQDLKCVQSQRDPLVVVEKQD